MPFPIPSAQAPSRRVSLSFRHLSPVLDVLRRTIVIDHDRTDQIIDGDFFPKFNTRDDVVVVVAARRQRVDGAVPLAVEGVRRLTRSPDSRAARDDDGAERDDEAP